MASKLTKLFPSSKKLLVLNFGGLLYQKCLSRKDFPPNRLFSDFDYGSKKVFKRPFYEDFLDFCFERFDVGVWSSIQSKYLDVVLENMMGESKNRLKFVWHQDHCTKPGLKWVNSEKRPIFLKNLMKLCMEPNLSHFSLSNTLLIDNAPYIGLRNLRYTAIYPYPFVVSNTEDNFLGPDGEMRVFLDGLANAKDVPSYVEENQIGQPPLTPSHSDWGYYSKMLTSLRSREDKMRNMVTIGRVHA